MAPAGITALFLFVSLTFGLPTFGLPTPENEHKVQVNIEKDEPLPTEDVYDSIEDSVESEEEDGDDSTEEAVFNSEESVDFLEVFFGDANADVANSDEDEDGSD